MTAIAPSVPRRTVRPAATRSIGGAALLVLPLAFLTVFLAMPIGFVVRTAFSQGGEGIREGLGNQFLAQAALRTLVLAAVVTVLTVVLGTVYGLAIATSRGAVRGILVAALLASVWVSLLVRTVGWLLFFEGNGVLDQALAGTGVRQEPLALLQTTAAMFPAMVNVMLPFVVIPVWSGFAGHDPAQLRAARSLGARPALVLRRVVLPQARAGIIAGAVLVFTLSLSFYVIPVLIGGPRNFTVASLIGEEFSSAASSGLAPAATISLVLVVATLVLYFIADRVFAVSESWAKR